MSVYQKANWGGTSTPELEPNDLLYFCQTIERIAGIALKPSKHDLVRTRLRSRVAVGGYASFAEYRQFLESLPKDDPEWQHFTNLLTTNKTDFFREPKHFEFLISRILPEWLETKQGTFNVWSAASSTGEEPYTLAMVLDRHLPKDRTFRILATDIDTTVLGHTKNAVYPISKKDELPPEYQQSSIDIGRNEARGWFRIKPHLKEHVQCKTHNLVGPTTPGDEVFDLVLCRNVLIYFAPQTIERVQNKLFRTAKPGAYLFIGHSESFQGLEHRWSSVGPSVFRKPGR
jgi:chemotaxis protein methyltransferase CheR